MHLMRRFAGVTALLLLALQPCLAIEIPLVAEEEVRIPIGESIQFEFGTVPQADTTVTLDIQTRMDAHGLGGSNFFMTILLNNRVVNAAKTRTVVRLINRPLVSPVAPELPHAWFGSDKWRVLYAPDFEAALQQTYYEGNPYQLVLDVTDLTNPAAENRLEIINHGTTATRAIVQTEAELVIGNLVIRAEPGASPTMAEAAVDVDGINRGTPAAGPAPYRGELTPGGGFNLTINDRQFAFSSLVSYPNAGLNPLTAAAQPERTGHPQWQVRVQPTENGGQVIGECPDYRIRRTVTFGPRKVDIADEITNLNEVEKLGVIFRNYLELADHEDPAIRLAGNPDPAINRYWSAANPSVFMGFGDVSLGMICEDDIFRHQAWLYYDDETESAGLSNEYLCLEPGGSYTLEWSVYPVASAQYFDFINLVRQDWGSNYTIKGAWSFFYNPDTILDIPVEQLREDLERLDINYINYCGGWVDRQSDPKRIGFGTGVLDDYWADFRRRLKEAGERIREARPDCKVLVYYDSQRDTSEAGQERFRDSWVTDRNGNQFSTNWSGMYSQTWSVVATPENSFGKAMLQAVDDYFDLMNVDGLYWDEMEGTGYGFPLVTYNAWDGYSCIINKESYTIERELGITQIMGEAHRLAVIDRARARGGMVMGNGPTGTKKLLAKQIQRMVEIQHNDYWSYEGNLDTPLGYASGRMDFGNWIRSLRQATLLVGTRNTYTHEISAHVFPFTPIEIHAGYLLGEERIISIHSGNFGWPGENCLVQVRYFDEEGKLTETDFATTIGTEARTAVEVPEGEAVVLVRLPATLTPAGDAATVSGVSYDASGLAFSANAPAGGQLILSDGPMTVAAGGSFTVSINGAARQVTAADDGTLAVDLPAGAADVEIRPAG